MSGIRNILLFVAGGLVVFIFWQVYEESQRSYGIDTGILVESLLRERKDSLSQEYRLVFAGDIMLDRGVRRKTEEHGEDYTFPFLIIKDDLVGDTDIMFGNLESVISDQGRDVGGQYSFRAPPEAVEALRYLSFDIVSLANNHAFDWGRDAFEDTMKRLQEEEIEYAGAGFDYEEAHTAKTITLGDDALKVGFLGYTEFLFPYAIAQENRSGVTDFTEENMVRDIEKAKEEVDILIVTFHYGTEYQREPNEKQIRWSQKAIDAGADFVIGHHPHVTQPVEEYNNSFIAYSLGNFVFDQYFSEETMSGFLLEVIIDGNGETTEVNKLHYKLTENYQPYLTEKESFFVK